MIFTTAPHRCFVSASLRLSLSFTVLTLAVGCNKSDSEKPAGMAPLAAPAPGAPAAAAPPAAAPVAAPAPAAAPPPAEAAPAAPADPKATISGEIVIASSMKGNVKPNDVIYLVARRLSDNPTARGSLVAVKKFAATKFPIDFTLGAADMMFQNGAFEGDLALSVRVDKDGDAMTRRKGDVFGGLPKVRVGAKGVKLSLNQLQKEDESLAAPGPVDTGGPSPHGPGGANPHMPGGANPHAPAGANPHGALPKGHP